MIFRSPCIGQLFCSILAAVGIVVKQVNSLLDGWMKGRACLNALFTLINRFNLNKQWKGCILHNAVLIMFTAMITCNTSLNELSSKSCHQDFYSPLSVWLDKNTI